MVVKEDGTKWACQSCLKGHRVSQCTHKDRDLHLVPKKGRPVTQCHHCRLERKKRSAHVKCECGETDKPQHSKEKCIHLREAEERTKAAGFRLDHAVEKEASAAHLVAVAEEQGCCCHHGGKCACATLKKEPVDETVTTLHGPAVKPRLDSTKSDGSITVFHNGHHKPVHRKNHAAHESGLPYKVPMPRAHTDQGIPAAARRSVDSLVLDSTTPFQSSALWQQTGSSQDVGSSQSKSEHASPKLSALGNRMTDLNDNNPVAFDYAGFSQFLPKQDMLANTEDSFAFPSLDPMSGLTDDSFDPWSAMPCTDSSSMPNNPLFTSAWATSNDNLTAGQPALTTASSNTQSEIDEIPSIDENLGFTMPSIQEDFNDINYNLFNAGSPHTNRRSLPPSFFGNLDMSTTSPGDEWQHAFGSSTGADSDKQRPQNHGQSNSFDQAWQMPTFQSANDNMQRSLALQNQTGRPQSLSIGPGSAPDDDIFKQLFPDIDINASVFPSANDLQSTMANTNVATSAVTAPSTTSGYGPLDDVNTTAIDTNNEFHVRAWIDGSFSMPTDDQDGYFNMPHDNPDASFSMPNDTQDTSFSMPNANQGGSFTDAPPPPSSSYTNFAHRFSNPNFPSADWIQ